MTNHGERALAVLLVLWVCVIFSFSLTPGRRSLKESGTVQAAASQAAHTAGIRVSSGLVNLYRPWFPKKLEKPGEFFVRKTAHLIEYALLGALCLPLALFSRRKKSTRGRRPAPRHQQALRLRPFLLLLGPAVALTDEMVVQRFLSANRTWSLSDASLDTVGFALGAAVCFAAALLSRAVRRKRGRKAARDTPIQNGGLR